MLIVDAQVHVWAGASPARPWPPGGTHTAHRQFPVGAAETLGVLDAAGVARAVLVPPSWAGDHNDVALAAAARHPDRFAVMGRLPLPGPPDPARVRSWRDQAGMLGVRVTLHREPWRSALSRGELDWFWSAAAEVALPVMVYAPLLPRALAGIAARYPDLPLVVDHLALPVGAFAPDVFAGLPALLALARFPRVAVKASALPCHSRHDYPFADLHEPLRRVFEAFGPDRMFWGSDWTRLPCPYQQNLALFRHELPFLRGADRDAVLGGALLRWLGWPEPGGVR